MGLKNTPIYVKPQLSSGGGICRVNVLVGTRYDTGKSVDSIIIRVPWPPVARSADLTANHGTVSYSHSTKVNKLASGLRVRNVGLKAFSWLEMQMKNSTYLKRVSFVYDVD